MASSLIDVCRFNPTAGGTTDWTYSSAVTGYQSPTAAGAVNGATYSYRAESADLTQWEVGTGAYNSGTGVFARTAVLFNSSGTTSKINFSAAPQVAIVALAEDLICVRVVRKQVFTSSGTYTPDPKLINCIIECVGGGGGGGGVAGSATGYYGAGGGGAGAYARLVATPADIGASKTVTIGAGGAGGVAGANNGSAGGDTSVGTLCVGKGGSGGTNSSNANGPGIGGAGGVAGTGDIASPGSPGLNGFYNSTANVITAPAGMGGSSIWGGGAKSPITAVGVNAGIAATGTGGGGSGAFSNSTASNAAGGDGFKGVVVILEYCSA